MCLQDTAPVIPLNRANPMIVECHTSFTDPGASANDTCDGPVPVSSSGSVNINVSGSYTITLKVKDAAGNIATVVRRVFVPVNSGGTAIDGPGPGYTVTGCSP